MKLSFLLIITSVSLLLSCENHESHDSSEIDTIAAVDSSFTEESQPKAAEKIETLDSIYILEQEPDISIDLNSLSFKPDFVYVANNSLFFGEKENFRSEKVALKDEVLSFTWSPDGRFIYFGVKTQVNEITKKKIEELRLEAYDLKIYKFDFQKPSKAEYITTLYDRTNEYSEGNYFLDYKKPDFDISCNGDTLLIHCEPAGGTGGFSSAYIVAVSDRKTSYLGSDLKCVFPGVADKVDSQRLKFNTAGDTMKVFNTENEMILSHNSWTTLFGKDSDFTKEMKIDDSYSPYFDFSRSPDSNEIVFSAFSLGPMDERIGSTYIYDRKDSTTFTVSDDVVLGSWYDGEHRWLSNSNLLLHCLECSELLFVDTKENKVNKIEHVNYFQAAPF